MKRDDAKILINNAFPGQLKDCLELANMNSKQLAEATGVDVAMIRNYLSGRFVPNAVLAYAIAETLGVTMELLLTGEEI